MHSGDGQFLLNVNNLTIRRNASTILSNVSFSLKKGEATAILGPTGSGKTTLLLALAGLLSYDGEIKLYGKEITEYSKIELASFIGFVSENPEAQFVAYKVGDEVAFSLENLGIDPTLIAEKVRSSLRIMGLEHKINDPIHELSGGQKHRLAIASALAPDPALLILDNPQAHLDPPTLREFSNYLKLIKTLGKSIIITAYNLKKLDFIDKVLTLEGELGRCSISHFENLLPSPQAQFAPPAKEVILVENIYFAYKRGIDILRGVSLKAHKGERLALIGRNGAGKTTLGKIIAGLLKPRKGKVSLNGVKPGIGVCGYVFQDPDSQFVGKTPLEDISSSFRVGGYSKLESIKLTYKTLKELELDEFAQQPIYELNRGLKRLISVIGIAALKPKVIVLDEPTLALDEGYTQVVKYIVSKLANEGSAIIVITHDLDFASEVCDRAAVLKNGTIIFDGKADQIGEMIL